MNDNNYMREKRPIISAVVSIKLAQTLTVLAVLAVGLPSALRAQGMPPAPVRVVTAELIMLAPTVDVPGTVISRYDSRLSAEVAGRITWIAEVGTTLKEGETVAEIYDSNLELQLEEFRGLVSRERARLTYLGPEVERLRQLAEQNIAAKSRLDQTVSDLEVARSDLRVARSRLRQLEDQISKTNLVAPFDGIVTERLVNVGERVAKNDQVARLINPLTVEVLARAPLRSVTYLADGDQIRLLAFEKKDMGSIRTIVPFGNPQSHMFELRVDIDVANWRVGESLRLAIPTAQPRKVLAVPRDALVLRRSGASIYRINDDGTAEQVQVTTGAGDGVLIEILGAVQAGDTVVIRGAERLRPGQPVMVLNGGSESGGNLAGTASD